MPKNLNKRLKCESLLLNNGFKVINGEDGLISYTISTELPCVDICEDKIVFVGEDGDFLDIPLNEYALLGALINFSMIGINFKEWDNAEAEG